jgi:hypothetical protein
MGIRRLFNGKRGQKLLNGAREADEILGTPSSKKIRPDDFIEGEIVQPKLALPSPEETLLDKIKKNRNALITSGIIGAGALGMLGGDESGQQPPEQPNEQASSEVEDSTQEPLIPKEPVMEAKQDTLIPKEESISQIDSILSKSKAQEPLLKDINVGDGGMDIMTGLKEAQAKSERERDIAEWGQIGDLIGSGLARAKPQTDFFEGQKKAAERHVTNFKDLVKAQADDPNSELANGFRDYAKNLGFDIKGKMSLNQAKDLIPMLYKQFESEEDRKFKQDQLKQQKELKAMELKTKADKVPEEEMFEKKEKIKEDVKVRTENRKERKLLEKDLVVWDNLENIIDDAIQKAKKYNKGYGPGTGTAGVVKSWVGALSPETQALNTQLNKLSLDQLVKQFSGMSKAIDTPVERAAFESTVPGIGMDDNLLMEELLKRKKAAQSAKERIKMGMNRFDRYGSFTDEEESTKNTSTQEKTSQFPKQVRKGNLVTTVENEQELKEAQSEGWQ